jgi:hypothetical protein
MDIMASPETDIFSMFVFNNIMAEAFNYEPPFFPAPYPPLAIKPLASVIYDFRQIAQISNKLLFFHVHNG